MDGDSSRRPLGAGAVGDAGGRPAARGGDREDGGYTRRQRIVGLFAGLLLTAAALFCFALAGVHETYHRRVERCENLPQRLGLPAEMIVLAASDGTPLRGWWVPADSARGVVVLLHDLEGQDASTLLPQGTFLRAARYSSFFLDLRAHGHSGGDRIALALEEPRDVAAALDWIATLPEARGLPVSLVGISSGGAVAIRSAAARPDVAGVLSIGSFSSCCDLIAHGIRRMMPGARWLAEIRIPFYRLALVATYRTWPAKASPVHDIPRIAPRPVLLVHGGRDRVVPVEQAMRLAAAGGPGTELRVIDGAGSHFFSDDGAGPGEFDRAYRETVLGFLERVGAADPTEPGGPGAARPGVAPLVGCGSSCHGGAAGTAVREHRAAPCGTPVPVLAAGT